MAGAIPAGNKKGLIMLYFELNEAGAVVAVSNEYPAQPVVWARKPVGGVWDAKYSNGYIGAGWISRTDMDEALAAKIAAAASIYAGKTYVLSDSGPSVWPRFDVVEAPAVGDDVSMAFNGDAYPIGKVIKICADMKQIVVDGPRGVMRFYKKGARAAWLKGGWSLIPGSIDKLNPEF